MHIIRIIPFFLLSVLGTAAPLYTSSQTNLLARASDTIIAQNIQARDPQTALKKVKGAFKAINAFKKKEVSL
jgi:hypothetical protein